MKINKKIILILLILSISKLFAQEYKSNKEDKIEVKAQTVVIQKEIEIQEKALDLEKKKALIKDQEVEFAKKEAAKIKEITKNKYEIIKANKLVEQKVKEAETAKDKVKIAEEKMLAAQESARIVEEELSLVNERVKVAESKIAAKKNLFYKKLFYTFFILSIGYLIIFLIVSIVNRNVKELKIRHILRNYVVYFTNAIIIIIIVFVWFQNISSLTIIFSAIGAGLALALQEVLLCIAGWFLIMIRKPFEVGDRVELGSIKGDVIDIRFFQTSLLEIGNWIEADQSTGRIVNIPNSMIFKKENYNYNKGFEFIWNEIKIIVTFESNWKKAEDIMMKHALKESKETEKVVKRKIEHMAKRYMIHYTKFTPIVYVDIKENGIELSLRYLTEAQKRRTTHSFLCKEILNEFEKEEIINFAYPTYRIVK